MVKQLSVVIVSYKNLTIIEDCLNSIYKYNDLGDQLEIIIVDNSPSTNIFNYVKEKWKKVIIIKNENNGFGEANNVGAKAATGKVILFLNPDTILIEPIFEFALNKFKNHKDLALFGLKLVDENLDRNMSYYILDGSGFLSSQFNKIFNKIDFYLDGKMFTSGANIFILKNIFIEIGMFDENIFMYYEESDLIKRLKKMNFKTAYFKEKRIIHLEGKTTSSNLLALERRLDSLKYYCKKYNQNLNNYLEKEIRYTVIKINIYKFMRKEYDDLKQVVKKIESYKS